MKKALLLLPVLLMLQACYSVRLTDPALVDSPEVDTRHQFVHSLFWGIVPLGRGNLAACGQGQVVKRIKTRIGGLGLIAYAITGGIYVPMHVKVICANDPRGAAPAMAPTPAAPPPPPAKPAAQPEPGVKPGVKPGADPSDKPGGNR